MRYALVLGFSLGFVTASPIGPIGLLCLRRTLSNGVATGLVSALGISTAYGFWSFVALHGVVAASQWIEQEELLLEFAIGLFFLLYGLNGIFNEPSVEYPRLRSRGYVGEFLSTFLVVFLNPTTFMMFSALFTLFGGAPADHGVVESLEIAGFVFSGAMVFWLVVAQTMQLARKRLDVDNFGLVSRLSSVVILVFGGAILVHGLIEYLQRTV